jgi:septal ring factor EnvC (AmiA/AmiB activator)
VADLQAGRPVEAVSVPITLFRGALAWPVEGEVATAYGRTSADRPGAMPRPGVEMAAAEGIPVLNVYPGVVTYADAFEGYGTLVIVDHEGHYSLYGYP